jgi:hypothetical protein
MQTEQQNDLREIALENQRRQEEMDRKMREMDIYGGNPEKPPTLRDLYEVKRKAATQYGGVDDVIEIEKELEKLRLQQEQEARQKEERRIADEDRAWRRQNREDGSTKPQKDEKTVRMMNLQDGIVEDVPVSQVTESQKRRTHIRLDDPRLDDGSISLPSFGQPGAQKPRSSSGALTPWGSDVPTPVATSTPAPGDEIKTIIRNRSTAVKGR